MRRSILPVVVVALAVLHARLALACTSDADCVVEPCGVACDGTGGCVRGVTSPGAVCRPAAAVCGVTETCDGVSTACPPDGFVEGGTVCRASAGDCDLAETCTGSSPACPP